MRRHPRPGPPHLAWGFSRPGLAPPRARPATALLARCHRRLCPPGRVPPVARPVPPVLPPGSPPGRARGHQRPEEARRGGRRWEGFTGPRGCPRLWPFPASVASLPPVAVGGPGQGGARCPQRSQLRSEGTGDGERPKKGSETGQSLGRAWRNRAPRARGGGGCLGELFSAAPSCTGEISAGARGEGLPAPRHGRSLAPAHPPAEPPLWVPEERGAEASPSPGEQGSPRMPRRCPWARASRVDAFLEAM